MMRTGEDEFQNQREAEARSRVDFFPEDHRVYCACESECGTYLGWFQDLHRNPDAIGAALKFYSLKCLAEGRNLPASRERG